MRPPVATKEQQTSRVNDIFRLVCAGAKFRHVQDHAEQAGWGIQKRQLQALYARAVAMVAEEGVEERLKQLAIEHAKLDDLFVKANEQGDIRAATNIVRLKMEALGGFPSKNAAIGKQQSQKGLVEEVLSDPEMLKLLKEAGTWTPTTLSIAEPMAETS